MSLTSASFPVDQIVQSVISLEHATVSFHNQVDEKGLEYYTQASTDLSELYLDQFFGHFNQQDKTSAYWKDIKTQVDVIQQQSMKLMYEDLYDLLYGDQLQTLRKDVLELEPLLQKILDDSHAIVGDVEDLVKRNKKLRNDKEEEALTLSDKSKITCVAAEVLNKTESILVILTDPKILSELELVIAAMDGKASLKKYHDWLLKLQVLLKEYDPKVQKMLPAMDLVIKNFENACTNTRELTQVDKVNMDWNELSDFLMKILKFLQNPPEPLSGDAIKLLMDLVIALEPKKVDVAKDLQVQLVHLNQDMQSFVTKLNNTLVEAQDWSSDLIQVGTDMKSLEDDVQKLILTLIKK